MGKEVLAQRVRYHDYTISMTLQGNESRVTNFRLCISVCACACVLLSVCVLCVSTCVCCVCVCVCCVSACVCCVCVCVCECVCVCVYMCVVLARLDYKNVSQLCKLLYFVTVGYDLLYVLVCATLNLST